jgi:hypothetical protein
MTIACSGGLKNGPQPRLENLFETGERLMIKTLA